MDIGNKIYSIIVCEQFLRIISRHDVKCQFGSIPEFLCQDATLTIKTLLQLRHKKNPNMGVIQKPSQGLRHLQPCNTHIHTGKIWLSPKLCSEIKRMYDKSLVKIITVNIKTSIKFKAGVKQVDSMSQVLFLLLMMEFSKTREDKWNALVLSKYKFAYKDNSPISTGQLVIRRPVTFTSVTLFDIF